MLPTMRDYSGILWAIPVGVVGALATVAFRDLIHILEIMIFGADQDAVFLAQSLSWELRLLIPALGGCVAGLFLFAASKIKKIIPNEDYMEAISIGDGRLPLLRTILRSLSSLASISTGASIGREGPMVQLAALAGSLVGQVSRCNTEQLKMIVACGAAAGVASAYNAPIAGAFFIAELVLGAAISERMAPLIVAAVVANITMRVLPGYHPLYLVPELPEISLGNYIIFIMLGIAGGALAPVYLAFLTRTKLLFRLLSLPPPITLSLGGLMVGGISLYTPQVWGNGYSAVSDYILHPSSIQIVVFVLICKLTATAISTGSGAVGGIFTPTLFVGASIGSLIVSGAGIAFPEIVQLHALLVIAGMGAFLAATTQAPLMSILMIFEMTMSYELMPALMLCCVISFVISKRLIKKPMYDATKRVSDRYREMERARGGQVKQIVRLTEQIVDAAATLADVRSAFESAQFKNIYLIDRGKFYGYITRRDFHDISTKPQHSENDLARNYASQDIPLVALDDTPPIVLQAFLKHDGERLPVVKDLDSRTFVGVISKADFLLQIESLV